jgi:tetrahydromethanopterin S-methyltransferase subunit E
VCLLVVATLLLLALAGQIGVGTARGTFFLLRGLVIIIIIIIIIWKVEFVKLRSQRRDRAVE